MDVSIDELRADIDSVDLELLQLINKRAQIVMQIARQKVILKLPLKDNARENEILIRICSFNDGPLDNRAVRKVLRRIMYECSRLQASKGSPKHS